MLIIFWGLVWLLITKGPTDAEGGGWTVTVWHGTASHYHGTKGFVGQATVALPESLGGHYTGSINGFVEVCAERCATLPVVDYCQCYWGTNNQRVVDLSTEAWLRITDEPLSRGLIRVTVSATEQAIGQPGFSLPNTTISGGVSR